MTSQHQLSLSSFLPRWILVKTLASCMRLSVGLKTCFSPVASRSMDLMGVAAAAVPQEMTSSRSESEEKGS